MLQIGDPFFLNLNSGEWEGGGVGGEGVVECSSVPKFLLCMSLYIYAFLCTKEKPVV